MTDSMEQGHTSIAVRPWWARLMIWLLVRFGQAKNVPRQHVELPEVVSRWFAERETARPLREQDRPPLVVISKSLEWNARQNALAEAVEVAKAMLIERGGSLACTSMANHIAHGIRALMTEGPVLASNQFDDRVPNLYELATMYRDLWAELDAEQKRSAAAKEERDNALDGLTRAKERAQDVEEVLGVEVKAHAADLARAHGAETELAKVKAILHNAETTPAGAWATELAAAKENVATLAVLLQETQAQRTSAEEACRLAEELREQEMEVARQALVRAETAESALLKANDHSEMYREAWAAMGASDCGLLKWQSVLDGIEGLREEHKEWGDRLNVLLSMLGPRCGETGIQDERAEGALRRILARLEEETASADHHAGIAAKAASRVEQAEAQASALRGALEGMLKVSRCQNECAPHDLTCASNVADQALAADAGRKFLESLQQAETTIASLRATLGKERFGWVQALNEVLTLPPTALPACSVELPWKARARVLRSINDALDAELHPVEVEIDLETDRIIRFHRPAPAVTEARAPHGDDPNVPESRTAREDQLQTLKDLRAADARELAEWRVRAIRAERKAGLDSGVPLGPVNAPLYPRLETVQIAALEWFDTRVMEVGHPRRDAAQSALYEAVGEWVGRSPDATIQGPTLEQRELVAAANLPAIICDPKVFGGKPSLRNARVAVEHILGMMAAGDSVEDLLRAYPSLEQEDFLACLKFAELSVERVHQATITERARCARIARMADLGEMKATMRGLREAVAKTIETWGAT